MTNTFWLLEMQGLLVSEVGILVCHQKLDKHPTRDKTAWEQYKKRTLAVSVPPGRERGKLLFSCRKDQEWTGGKVWAKRCELIKIVRKEPNDVWLALFPANKLPSGETLAGAMGRWWQAMWLLEDKKQAPDCRHDNLQAWIKKLADLPAPPANWHGPQCAGVFELFSLPSIHANLDVAMERQIFYTDNTTAALDKAEKSEMSRIKQKDEARQQNGFVAQAAVKAGVEVQLAVQQAATAAEFTYQKARAQVPPASHKPTCQQHAHTHTRARTHGHAHARAHAHTHTTARTHTGPARARRPRSRHETRHQDRDRGRGGGGQRARQEGTRGVSEAPPPQISAPLRRGRFVPSAARLLRSIPAASLIFIQHTGKGQGQAGR